jgi:hypothetical protein
MPLKIQRHQVQGFKLIILRIHRWAIPRWQARR